MDTFYEIGHLSVLHSLGAVHGPGEREPSLNLVNAFRIEFRYLQPCGIDLSKTL